mgnify:CR=1 FL=1
MEALKWDSLDVILVTGDSYIDHPSIGVSVIGHVLMDAGFKVGIIAQPDTGSDRDIARLGCPGLFWGVTSGSIDSMVANYTPAGRKRRSDDYTPGGINNARPDRAVIAYTNLIRRFFKDTCPIVLGGIEASLRRIAHFDFWTESVRRSILFDAKADILVYGMGERAVIELAQCIRDKRDYRAVKGLCYISGEKPLSCLELPEYELAAKDNRAFIEMSVLFLENTGYQGAEKLCQRHADRYLVQNPPQPPLTGRDLDRVYEMDYERDHHPLYEHKGRVKALDTIRFSITTHRGCFGGCSFCSISPHQGRRVSSRSAQSLVTEAEGLTRHRLFKGIIADVGGPTANMYSMQCVQGATRGMCRNRQCLFPVVCEKMKVDHSALIALLRRLRKIPGVKRVFVASGIRHDLIMADAEYGREYLKELVMHHISGQMKIAPEHIVDHVLGCMGKPGAATLIAFKDLFYQLNHDAGKRQFLTYYLIAAHPGCTLDDMKKLKTFSVKELRTNPEQVQIFTPLPSTISAVMYYTQTDPFTGQGLFVEKDRAIRQKHKDIILAKKRIGKSRVRR